MSINSVQAFPTQALGAGNVLAYTVPTGTTATIRAATLHNPTALPITGQVFIVSAAGTVGDTFRLVNKALGQNQSYLCPEIVNHILKVGDQVFFSGQNLNAVLSVVEQV